MSPQNNRTLLAASTTSALPGDRPGLLTPSEAIQYALAKGWHGGKSGAMAMGINVCSLMWIRTTMNYQYRYGTTTTEAMRYEFLLFLARAFNLGNISDDLKLY